MHVLVAAHDLYPDPGSGGTGRYVYETATRLVDRGHDVSVLTRRRGEVPARQALDGIAVYRFDLSIAGRGGPAILRQLPGAASTVARHVAAARDRAGAPDVLSFQGPVASALADPVVDSSVTRVATLHSPWPTEYRIKTRGPEGTSGVRRLLNVSLRRAVEGRVIGSSDRLVTLSSFMREEARRVYGPATEATVIPGGVDADRFTPDGRAVDRIDGEPAFLTVRRLSGRMGHGLLLAAFASVLDSRPGARLYIAGDGPLRGHLEAAARSLDVDGATTFLGYVPDEDLPACYRSADVFVLPTRELEGFGLATLEALATGRPVVATPVGGTVELLAEFEAALDPPERMLASSATPDALAASMLAWSDLSADELTAAGDACRRVARRRFPWDRTVAGLERVYADPAAPPPRDAPPDRPIR